MSGYATYQALTFKMYFVTSTIHHRVNEADPWVRNPSYNLPVAVSALLGR